MELFLGATVNLFILLYDPRQTRYFCSAISFLFLGPDRQTKSSSDGSEQGALLIAFIDVFAYLIFDCRI